jgi:hypothetical protein
MTHFFRHTLIGLLLINSTVIAAQPDDKVPANVYYRYVNEQGIKVLDRAIPPQYIRNGYEVVAINGDVVRVVDPAPHPADAERIQLERNVQREQAQNDALLRRRYSTLHDIDAVKARSLLELQSNIDILQTNLANTRLQIESLQTRAALSERSGREVPEALLNNIATLESDVQETREQIRQRQTEYQLHSDRFDEDRRRFEIISR